MICQILFPGKNKENLINLSSAESAHNMVNYGKCKILILSSLPIRGITLTHANL